ncbi:hypothetical protein HX884_03925 [Enterobacter sp. SECR19-1250]|uniref:hypothetical protein n=1 Tax=Enterobacter sp. SECR19-1250 TaxID=2749084 RepID=UPI0015B787BD|nr:hypothetical protein [Enterobacter sp. SECR19-1250]NWJ78791.1 hypothetical protein [Enterobacter sp. SECR19-1250]
MCWLINYILDIAGTETTTHLLLRADNLQMAELAARRMGRTWWEGSLSGGDKDGYWTFHDGTVWFSGITMLDAREVDVLTGLKFLDIWEVSGQSDNLNINDDHGNAWEKVFR